MALLILTVLGSPALADGPVRPVNTDPAHVALHGFDAVAYFTEGKAVKGSPSFTHDWNSARWQFASASNRDKFAADPPAFAPQFGGYCAWAVSRNYTADTDPEAFDIVDGKLYLNYSKLVQVRWKVDRTGNIARAHQNWPRLVPSAKGTK